MSEDYLCGAWASVESGKNCLNLATPYFRKAQADLESAKHLCSVTQYANTAFLAQRCGEKAQTILKELEEFCDSNFA